MKKMSSEEEEAEGETTEWGWLQSCVAHHRQLGRDFDQLLVINYFPVLLWI